MDGEARRLAGILLLVFPDLELRDDELKSIIRQSNDDMVLVFFRSFVPVELYAPSTLERCIKLPVSDGKSNS